MLRFHEIYFGKYSRGLFTFVEARPGDLVFYSNGTNVNHVAIYVGNGQVVHASNERVGITRSDMYYRTPVAIKNVLGD